ncbi:MAG: inositol monophosphatase family protein [Nitrospirota bacterium]
MPSKRKAFLETAIQAAGKAGDLILKNLGKLSKKDIDVKQTSDFVTRVDRESEEIILKTIKNSFPDHTFLTEESLHDVETEQYRWIIDPLDGTTNYIHRYPVFSISIALEYRRDMVLGVVYEPLRGDMFTAEKGKGAFLNSRRIEVSGIDSLRNCLVTTGFPFRKKELIDPYLTAFKNLFLKISDLRRAGSAALDLSYLACGRCDAFFEIGLSPWDIAAGSLLIEEAGGVVTDFSGGRDYLRSGNIVAGNPIVHRKVLKEVKKVFAGIIDR